MLEIDNKIVSLDLLREGFCCELEACRGECCVQGNAGAPLEEGEVSLLERLYADYKPFMTREGIEAVERHGFAVLDDDGDLTTPLVGDAECAYSFVEDGVTLCAIEKAWRAAGGAGLQNGADVGGGTGSQGDSGIAGFPKPISCHLYPIRVARFGNGTVGLNYHRWSICAPARRAGIKSGVKVYRALEAPIIRAFGRDFFDALTQAEQWLKKNENG